MTASQFTRWPDEEPMPVSNDPVHAAAIYFPSWHDEPRRRAQFGAGWSEWKLIEAGRPRFEGHYQPIVPAWGYADETIPANMQRSCTAAANAGFEALLWDWYWYDNADFLNTPLNETYLGLEEPGIKFALMWANHDWRDVFPASGGQRGELFAPGAVDSAVFRHMTGLIIDRYFSSDRYWRPDGRNWFTIYQLQTLIDGLGGDEATTAELTMFRERSTAAGCGDIHFNVMGAYGHMDPARIASLGIDSLGPYNWAYRLPLDQGMQVSYEAWRRDARDRWREEDAFYRDHLAYIPSVTVGWDSTTRVAQDEDVVISDWPFWPVVVGNTPDELDRALGDSLRFLDGRDGPRILTVNAWNEWTEGSYLEPDSRYGTGYLDACARWLGPRKETAP
jgi:hypothetical protein